MYVLPSPTPSAMRTPPKRARIARARTTASAWCSSSQSGRASGGSALSSGSSRTASDARAATSGGTMRARGSAGKSGSAMPVSAAAQSEAQAAELVRRGAVETERVSGDGVEVMLAPFHGGGQLPQLRQRAHGSGAGVGGKRQSAD